MLMKLIKLLLCLITATAAFNAHAVFIAELEGNGYEWVELNSSTSVNHISSDKRMTNEKNTIYEYEYSSKELAKDLSQIYAPWFGEDEWQRADPKVASAEVAASDSYIGEDRKSSPSVKVLLLIISGLIGIFGLTKDRSQL